MVGVADADVLAHLNACCAHRLVDLRREVCPEAGLEDLRHCLIRLMAIRRAANDKRNEHVGDAEAAASSSPGNDAKPRTQHHPNCNRECALGDASKSAEDNAGAPSTLHEAQVRSGLPASGNRYFPPITQLFRLG
jgi:hypothetical protein